MSQLLEALSHKVPVMTDHQIRDWMGEEGVRAIRELVRAGLIHQSEFLVRPILHSLDRPLYASADGPCVAAEIASRVRNRYGVPQIQTIYSLGGPVRRPQHISHDVGVASVYLWHQQNRSEFRWLGEKPARGCLNPDATVIAPDGTQTSIEFAGTYRAPKIQAIVNFNNAYGSTFELW